MIRRRFAATVVCRIGRTFSRAAAPGFNRTLAVAVVALALAAPACRESNRAPVEAPVTRDLKAGFLFPEVTLRGLDGSPVSTLDITAKGDVVVLFASTSCEGCSDLVASWRAAGGFPQGLSVVAIVDEEPSIARRYVEETRFPFPMYCDDKSVFYSRYGVDSYPQVAGVTEGRVLFLKERATPFLTPTRVRAAFTEAKSKQS